MRFLKLLPVAILPALFACKSTDTRYESDRTAQSGAYSESERATRDEQGSSYAHSDYDRGVSTVDLRASGQSDLKGTATLLKSQDGDSSPRLIVHLENAQPGTYQVALASSCDFDPSSSSWSGGAGAGIGEDDRSDRSFGGSAGVTGDAEGDELSGSASAGGAGVSGSAGVDLDDEDGEIGATAQAGDDGLSGSASLGDDSKAGGSFGGELGMNKELGEITVGEDGTGHFEETLTAARIDQSAAIVVRRSNEESGSDLSERTASEGQMDGTLIAACGLISLPAAGGDWGGASNARFNNDPRELDSDGQNLGDMTDQDTIVDD